MAPSSLLIIYLIASILFLVFLIAHLKVHASIALIVTSLALAIATKIPLTKIVSTLEGGIGSTLSFLAMIMAFGGVLGKMLEVSGGAEQIAQTLLRVAGKKNATWVMAAIGFIVGIPVFSDVGFLLMVPLVAVIAKNAGVSSMRVGVPLLLSLHVIHCIVPPHPAATAVTSMLNADIGKVILLGIGVGLVCAIAGTLYMNFLTRAETGLPVPDAMAENINAMKVVSVKLPGFGITLFTILLPLFIMVSKTILEAVLPAGNAYRDLITFVGNPFTALFISVIFAYWSLGISKGDNLEKLGAFTGESFRQIANVMLIIACGGAFNAVISESGISHLLGSLLSDLPVSPIILAWLLTGVIHLAVGSATIAMLSAAGIIAPLLQSNPSLSPVAMTIAVGSGAIGFVQFTDSLIWLGKEYLGLSISDALKSITASTMIASCIGLAGALIIQYGALA